MIYNSIWIFLVILQACVTSLPIQDRYDLDIIGHQKQSSPHGVAKYDETVDSGNQQVISVRITSSVAVGRGKEKLPYKPRRKYEPEIIHTRPDITSAVTKPATTNINTGEQTSEFTSGGPSNLIGANVEYIKQLNAKKDYNSESFHPFQLTIHNQQYNENETAANETPTNGDDYDDYLKDIPIARKVPSASNSNTFDLLQNSHGYHYSNMEYRSKINPGSNNNVGNETILQNIHHQINYDKNRNINAFVSGNDNSQVADSLAEPSTNSATVSPATKYVRNYPNIRLNNEQNNARHTTVSFNIIHDAKKSSGASGHSDSYITSSQAAPYQNPFYNPPKIYSQPAQVYSEPAKFYSEPAKVYSEPAKIYSEPSKVYSEPAKIYSEPAKFYSEPASLHLNDNVHQAPPAIPTNYPSWQEQRPHTFESSTMNTTPASKITQPYPASSTQMEHQPEKNYEVEEKISVLTDGRSHGVQESSTEKCKEDNCKTGYVVEGRQFKKYRVEERTSDGFIVGEYGVVRNEDGALRGVRYTADSDASPRLIHDALMKFLQLK